MASDKEALQPIATSIASDDSTLGTPKSQSKRRFFWQRREYDFRDDAIATQPSVFDDAALAKFYAPSSVWENSHRFDPSARWTWGEERRIVRKIDLYIMVLAAACFFTLELDRANISQANTDNFLEDLGLNTNDYNTGNTVFKAAFLFAELPSQLISKRIGPDRWIPMQMCLWSIVALCQCRLSGRASFLICRALLGALQGGFIPDIVLFLSYFYTSAELGLRLTAFWMTMYFADICSALIAYGIMHMRGLAGWAGWRWLFLIEGLFTLCIGLMALVLMPPSPTQTASRIRGRSGWFSPREETIMVTRVLRDDPGKSSMHNRQAITPRMLWSAVKDYDMWPLYLIGLSFLIPTTAPQQYLTLTLRNLGFGTFASNLLTIPAQALAMLGMVATATSAHLLNERTFVAMFMQIWVLPNLVSLYALPESASSRWGKYVCSTLIVGNPYPHAIQVAWASRNSQSVHTRTVSASLYNMAVQVSNIIGSNVYRERDSPRYRVGNMALIIVTCVNICIYVGAKVYYVRRNRSRAAIWDRLTVDQKQEYLETTTDQGNKRLDFRFAH